MGTQKPILTIMISLLLLSILFGLNRNAFAHIMQVAYCRLEDGSIRLWAEHWHDGQAPDGTATLRITSGNQVSTQTAQPSGRGKFLLQLKLYSII